MHQALRPHLTKTIHMQQFATHHKIKPLGRNDIKGQNDIVLLALAKDSGHPNQINDSDLPIDLET